MSDYESVGFWSYVHRDNDLDRGRVGKLAQDLANEFELLTGEVLKMFVDSQAIEWGEEWRSRIDRSLRGVTFLIAIVTPLYMRSPECRREFLTFTDKFDDADGRRILLPILYTDTPAVGDPNDNDAVARLVRRTQYQDWRALRLAAGNSPEYRRAVNGMALRIFSILQSNA